ncbi:MAG: aldo/keto reductase [Planctomycetota bacterium]
MPLRKIAPDGTQAPLLGFGGMRLSHVTQQIATAIIKRMVELGVKYIETAPQYKDSEEKIGLAVKTLGVRDKVLISTKSSNRKGSGMRADLEMSLKRLRTNRLDFYHMWFVDDMNNFKMLSAPDGALKEAKKARDEGLFDHLGITTHAKNDEIKRFIDTGEFEVVTLYYNAVDVGVEEVVEYAHKKGVGVVVMGPLKGGFLLADNSEKLLFLRDARSETNAQGALRWLAADPRVSVMAVGYTDPKQVDEAYRAVTTLPMTQKKRKEIVENFKALEKQIKDVCSGCDYCKEHCPEQIPISSILMYLAQYEIYGIKEYTANQYKRLKVKADVCKRCNQCLEHCPQKLNIPVLLEKAAWFKSK